MAELKVHSQAKDTSVLKGVEASKRAAVLDTDNGGLRAARAYLDNPHFSFYRNRWKSLLVSVLLVVAGLAAGFIRGYALDIQFRGGSILEYTYTGELNPDEAGELIEETIGAPVTAQSTRDFASGQQSLVVEVSGSDSLSTDLQTAVREALLATYPDNGIEVADIQVVEPFIGREMLLRAVAALLIASVLIVAYVWIRFRSISGPSAGVFALLALLHDILIAFFAFVVMGSAINDTVVAVVLSILGWSVNDTIVIYDRIRENSRKFRDEFELPELVDLSIRQSITRAVTTAVCTFLALLVAYIFAASYGIESIIEFSLPMLVGTVAGSFSTIFLAAPFWAQWMTRGERRPRAAKVEEEASEA